MKPKIVNGVIVNVEWNNHRKCFVCGTIVNPMHPQFMTAHEYRCYQKPGGSVPAWHLEQYAHQLAHDIRSKSAKLAALKRRRQAHAKSMG